MTFARESFVFVLPFVAVAILLAVIGAPRWALVVAAVALALLLFFRIPRRSFDGPAEVVLAPANGKVTHVGRAAEPLLGEGEWLHVVTFLSVFNVHVQRAPVSGTVIQSRYTPGRKVAAFRDDAGDVNEHHLTVIETGSGERFGIKQIAGLLARRVVSHLEPGDEIARGELMGLIKFGSRVDLYLPTSYRVEVQVGQFLDEGESIVAVPAGGSGAGGS